MPRMSRWTKSRAGMARPCYVYSRHAIESAYREYRDALAGRPALIAYSVKANPNLAVLGVMSRLGAGFDIVSGANSAASSPPAAIRARSCFRA